MSDSTVQNKTLIFKKIPTAAPVPGEHLVVESRPFDTTPPPGGVTFAIISASYDPYLRGKMRESSAKSYSPAFPLDGPISNATIARVLKSDSPDFKEGELVYALLPLAEYASLTKDELKSARKIANPYNLELGLFLGPLGMPGLTGWSSLYEIGKPKKGETIFISSAAGAVGQVVGQVAKREGLRVIGSVGSDDKLDFVLKDLEFDGAFNYKKEKASDALKRLAPDGIDIYYENVGGDQLEAAIDALNDFGRIVACGMISQYNLPADQRTGPKNIFQVVSKRLDFRGFIVSDPGFGAKYAQDHQEKLQKWLSDGSVKAKLSITDGIDNAAEGLVGLFEGKNFGKAVLKIRDE